MPDPKDPVQDALNVLQHDFPDSHLTYVRDDAGKRVVRRLRGDFQCLGPFPPDAFDKDVAVESIRQFWNDRHDLFNPNDGDSLLEIAFELTALSAQLAIVTGRQMTHVGSDKVAISGAVLKARVAARPAKHGKPGDPIRWQVDGYDNSLVVAPILGPTILPPPDDVAKAASKAVFGRRDVVHTSIGPESRTFAGADGVQSCFKIAYPAQRRLVGKWKRGAIVYWPVEKDAKAPFYVEPDGSYAVVPDNTGPYHDQPIALFARELPTAAPDGGVAPRRFVLIDDELVAANGPVIRTGRFSSTPPSPSATPAFVPLEGTGWRHDRTAASRVNPGVATDAHAFAHDVVRALLDLRDRNDINDPILPECIDVAIQVFPAAQPGEWRKSGKMVVIANADDGLPSSWMKRWHYCSDNTVVAHEIGHAFLYESCELEYRLESGALDEALADLVAVLLTGSFPIFDRPWVREDTPYAHAADALRDAAWSAPLSPVHMSPNDRVERGEYPNHYVDFARLGRTISQAAERASPRNDYGYIHWNCTILTRAVAMLARPAGTLLDHPETTLTATALGPEALADLVFCAVHLGLRDLDVTNRDGAETPFAQFRAVLLGIATSTQFDSVDGVDGVDGQENDMRLYPAQIINAFNAAGIGPILSLRGRPAGVPARYMPAIRLAPADWLIKVEQGRNESTWHPDNPVPIDVLRGQDITVTAQIANLGVSTDRARPSLSVLIETERDSRGQPTAFESFDAVGDSPQLDPGKVVARSVTIPADKLPDLEEPWILVTASDPWNALRSGSTARAAIAAYQRGESFELPLNAALIRLQMA